MFQHAVAAKLLFEIRLNEQMRQARHERLLRDAREAQQATMPSRPTIRLRRTPPPEG